MVVPGFCLTLPPVWARGLQRREHPEQPFSTVEEKRGADVGILSNTYMDELHEV